jgi:hypothetical protein
MVCKRLQPQRPQLQLLLLLLLRICCCQQRLLQRQDV